METQEGAAFVGQWELARLSSLGADWRASVVSGNDWAAGLVGWLVGITNLDGSAIGKLGEFGGDCLDIRLRFSGSLILILLHFDSQCPLSSKF